jgi:hypothetical protein
MNGLTYPDHISLKRWSADLVFRYRYDRLPILTDEDKWQDWANSIVGTGVFKENAAPSASTVKNNANIDNFNDWKEWAKAVYIVMIKVKNN